MLHSDSNSSSLAGKGVLAMNKRNKRFALRIYSRFPVQISMMYLGQNSAGQGIVQELSLVGCRILGNDPVVAGESLSVRISLPTSHKPLIIEQAAVKWVKGLEFGIAFEHLHPREAHRLQRLLDALLGSGNYSGLPAGSPNVKTPLPPHSSMEPIADRNGYGFA
jgi:hypothetical protein